MRRGWNRPGQGWALPYITDHKYRIHWNEGIDFTRMRMEMSQHWVDSDDSVLIYMNFTNVREEVKFTTEYGNGQTIANNSLNTVSAGNLALADNFVQNNTDDNYFQFIVNYKDTSRGKNLLIEGFTCIGNDCDFYEIVE